MLADTTIGIIYWQGLKENGKYDSANAQGRSAEISCTAEENCTSTACGGQLELMTTGIGNQTPTRRVTIRASGNVGIGTTSPQFLLDVNGALHYVSSSASSDERFKTNIRPLEDSLTKLSRLRTVSFEWNERINSARDGYVLNERTIGLIAQDVEKVFPEVVSRWKLDDDITDARAICYERLIPVLIDAIRDLGARVTALEARRK